MQIIYDTSDIRPEPCVATIGFFDGVHAGHRFLIRQIKEVAAAKGLHTALVTFPVHPRQVMQTAYCPEQLTSLQEKIQLMETLDVDYCLMLDFTVAVSQLTAYEFMSRVLKERFHVECLIVGYDHRFGHNRSEGFSDYVRYGKEVGIDIVHTCAYFVDAGVEMVGNLPVSSSLIRNLLHRGEVELAAQNLGYRYSLSGTVINGRNLGRKIGFPTANLKIDTPNKLIPADGVYAVWVTIEEGTYMGMLNIGFSPTVGNITERTIEVNLLHFHADLYGATIRLTFVKRIRPEIRFANLDELAEQLRKDAETAEQMLHASVSPYTVD